MYFEHPSRCPFVMLVSTHLLYLAALCALCIQIKPCKYRCPLSSKIIELEIDSVVHA